MKALRIFVRPTKRTDLMCIGCGGFRTELEVVTDGISDDEAEQEAYAGLHKGCVERVHRKRAVRR